MTSIAVTSIAVAVLLATGIAAATVLPGGRTAFAATPAYGAPEPLEFSAGCRADPDRVRVTAAFVGDVLMHDTLQIQAAMHSADGGFATTWSRLAPALSVADVTYANLEGPVAENLRCDGRLAEVAPPVTYANSTCGPGNGSSVYTNFPLFNYPPNLPEELAGAGVDIVSTANNHALDRYSLGADMTLGALVGSGLAHSGTRRAGDASEFHTITSVVGIGGQLRLAWLACTFGTNGLPDPHEQVLLCYDQSGAPNREVLESVSDIAARPDVDAVVVTPHWGAEYSSQPVGRQRDLARRLVGAGALAVIGAHPHVLQPLERVDVDGREGLVAYSLGNFVADQPDLATRTGIVLFVHFAGNRGEVWIDGVSYLPFYMAHHSPGTSYARALMPLAGDPAPGTAAAGAASLIAELLPAGNQIDLTDVQQAAWAPCDGPSRPSAAGYDGNGAADTGRPADPRPERREGAPAPPAPWERTRL